MPLPRRLRRRSRQLLLGDQRAGRVAGELMMMPRVRGVIAARIGSARTREAVLGVRAHDHRRRLGELDLLDQRRPAGHVRDHLVAGPEQAIAALYSACLPPAVMITSAGAYSMP